MAHFAKLDENNIVAAVHVVNNDVLDIDNEEASGIEFLANLHGYNKWKQTSYNNRIRGRYAGIGYTYNEELDEFIAPIFDEDQLQD